MHNIRKTGSLEVYKFLEQNSIIKVLNTYTNKNVYLIFCWKNKITMLEKIKFDIVTHNFYE